jgi:hypothetical protein
MTLPTPRPELSTGRPPIVAEAKAQQETLRAQVVTVDDHPPIVTAAGLDLAHDTGSDRAAAAVVVLEVATLARIDAAIAAWPKDLLLVEQTERRRWRGRWPPHVIGANAAPLLASAQPRSTAAIPSDRLAGR